METIADYPRPDFDRSHRWISLNGSWDFAPDPEDRGREEHWERRTDSVWSERIRVPFAWETPLSGVARHWLPVGWYHRSIRRPADWADERIILHIGAAHYVCQVWLNGQWIGEHVGGYLPFSFDVTDALDGDQGDIVLRVEAPVDKRFIPHGKQRSQPPDDYDSCAFTASSGVWQPVWLEGRPATYIKHVALCPSVGLDAVVARVTLDGPHKADALLIVQVEGHEPHTVPGSNDDARVVTLPIDHPRLWTPQTPYLYDVTVRVQSASGEDHVRCSTGLRRIEARGSHIYLNGERLYIRGVLDQGYWPTGGYTAHDGAAWRRDVELTLAAGYNLARKHIKLEDPRWLYWADRLGLLVWEEPPCVGRYAPEAIALFEGQLAPMVARDGNHPSIILWGIYNEEWGLDFRVAVDAEKQDAVVRAYDLLKAADATRPIIDNSGWWHVKTDLLDWHYYDNDVRRWGEVTAAFVADPSIKWQSFQSDRAPFRDMQLSVAGTDHASLPVINGEYGGGATPRERGWHLRWQTQELRRHDAVGGYIYTELCDVEHELCGIYTADRELKDLGCNPASVHAETTLIFDFVPEEPGCDLVAQEGEVTVGIRVSHHGAQSLVGMLTWRWEGHATPVGHLTVAVSPFVVTDPLVVRCVLPTGETQARLILDLASAMGSLVASAFLDVS